MKRIARWVGIALGLGIAGVVVVATLARFNSGPLGPFPGGPMVGNVVREPVADWSFAAEVPTIALQTFEPPRSRTVWSVVHAGALYVPCGLAGAKAWPGQVLANPMVLLRVDGALYLRRAVRVVDEATLAPVWALVADKYGPDVAGDYQSNWVFRMDPLEADG